MLSVRYSVMQPLHYYCKCELLSNMQSCNHLTVCKFAICMLECKYVRLLELPFNNENTHQILSLIKELYIHLLHETVNFYTKPSLA